MRKGIKSHTSDEDDRTFMEFGPMLIHGISERLSPHGEVGRLENIIISFESDSVLLIQLGDGHLALSVNRAEAMTVFSEIDAEIKKLSIDKLQLADS